MIPKFEYMYVEYEELMKAYIDCRRKKRSTINALEFEIDDNVKLYELWTELNQMKYEVGRSIAFCVDKPVKREVFAADFRDRIIHHLLINRLEEYFEKEFIEDSYSCRKGKGTDYGIRRCHYKMFEASDNFTKECYVIKCDLKSFFMTIDKNRLYDKLVKFLEHYKVAKNEKDFEFLCYLFRKIVFNEPQNNCILKQSWEHWNDLPKEKSLFYNKRGYGIPIGNLTSQIFANFYLSEFDRYVTEELGIKYYGRYVDDFYIFINDHEKITPTISKCREKLCSMGVTLHPKKLYVQDVRKGIKFIGGVLLRDRKYISNRTKGNMYWSLKVFNDEINRMKDENREPDKNEIEHFVSSVNSYLGFMSHYKTYKIRRKLLTSEIMKPWLEYCYYDEDYGKVTIFKEYKKRIGKKCKSLSRMEYNNTKNAANI